MGSYRPLHPIPNHGRLEDSSDNASSQVLTILLLGKICRYIRSEAYKKYFHKTQLLLGRKVPFWMSSDFDPVSHPLAYHKNGPVMEFIFQSEFLKENIRHVSLHWTHMDNKYLPDCLEWLANAPQLSTLDIVFSDPWNWGRREVDPDGPSVEEFFGGHLVKHVKWITEGPDGFEERSGGRPFSMRLDKITFKLDLKRASNVKAWKSSERFREIRVELERRHLKGMGERLDPKPCHAIDHYIGPYELHQGASTHV
ncbi:hypothetical protein B0T20DRAFT_498498 [Sordaria brevicollis]|uniref:Uncharacterized protein n=1 Tax=Sordaria brevicollis TaxID=83679 RepID=A0AAE0PEP5_SORBR|nr:hypothetical protein B0T20DRAFT_498498 [Sordaria brevicollis]